MTDIPHSIYNEAYIEKAEKYPDQYQYGLLVHQIKGNDILWNSSLPEAVQEDRKRAAHLFFDYVLPNVRESTMGFHIQILYPENGRNTSYRLPHLEENQPDNGINEERPTLAIHNPHQFIDKLT